MGVLRLVVEQPALDRRSPAEAAEAAVQLGVDLIGVSVVDGGGELREITSSGAAIDTRPYALIDFPATQQVPLAAASAESARPLLAESAPSASTGGFPAGARRTVRSVRITAAVHCAPPGNALPGGDEVVAPWHSDSARAVKKETTDVSDGDLDGPAPEIAVVPGHDERDEVLGAAPAQGEDLANEAGTAVLVERDGVTVPVSTFASPDASKQEAL